MRYSLYVILILTLSSCRQTPECESEFCPDRHYFLHSDSELVINGTHDLKSAFYYNGLEYIKRPHISVETGIRQFNEYECEDICNSSTSTYYDNAEFKWHFCSLELTGSWFFPWERTYVAVTGLGATEESQNIEFYSWRHNGNLNPDLTEITINKVSIPISELEDYFIGDTIMNDIQYNDLYKVELLGVDLYYSHELGMLNTYFDPYFILVPEL